VEAKRPAARSATPDAGEKQSRAGRLSRSFSCVMFSSLSACRQRIVAVTNHPVAWCRRGSPGAMARLYSGWPCGTLLRVATSDFA
jgi:hypothetical protein